MFSSLLFNFKLKKYVFLFHNFFSPSDQLNYNIDNRKTLKQKDTF